MATTSEPRVLVHLEQHGARVRYWPGAFDTERAAEIMAQLMAETPWEQEEVVMHGKTHQAKRLTATYADHAGLRYHYGGRARDALPWTPLLMELRDMVDVLATDDEHAWLPSNHLVMNLYRDGKDAIGLHADKTADLDRKAIYSLTLGAERDFCLKPIRTDRETGELIGVAVTQPLASGSVLSMEGATQFFYKHAVPPRAKCLEPRINLTFRRVRAHRGGGRVKQSARTPMPVDPRPALKRKAEEDALREEERPAKMQKLDA